MSDEDNTTTKYDYTDYYSGALPEYVSCDNSALKEFAKVFLPILYSLVFIIGFIGNGLVVCVLVKNRKQTNLTDICLLSLALSDLLFVLTLPFYSHYIVVGHWTFGDFMCRFTSGSHKTGFFSSIFFMVVMTLERHMVIMYARKVAQYRTLKAGVAITVVVWMLSVCVSLPAVIFTRVTNESDGLACRYVPENDAWRLYDIFTINILGLVIPLLVMIVSFSRIIPIVMNIKSTQRHRVVKMLLSIVTVFFLFWTPYNVSIFLSYLKSGGILDNNMCDFEANLRLSIIVTETFAYSHCCLNPIIYAFVGQKFKKRAMQMLKNWMPGILIPYARDWSHRKSSAMSRSSDATSNFIM